MTVSDAFSLIHPAQTTVDGTGKGTVEITHSLRGLIWKIYQIGFGLNQTALQAQVGAHFNGIPLTSSVQMQPTSFPGVPYAMESYFVGPPYVILRAGDKLVCSVISATAGDTFTAGAYYSEEQDPLTGQQWR
jgi:hypothetical protein